MPFAKKIYEKIKKLQTPSVLERISPMLAGIAKFFPGSFEKLSSLEGRYLAINEAVRELGDDISVIEVASGLSPRGLEWASKNFLYIETDLPGILETKKGVFGEIIKEENIKPNSKHIFLPLNAIDYEQWDKIGKDYFGDRNKKAVIVHEGLIPYFNKKEQEIFRDNIKRFLKEYSPNGAWITPDFNLPKKMNEGLIVRFSKKIIERQTKRRFNHFTSQQEVFDFLAAGDLEARVLDNSFIIEKLTCIPKLHLNKTKVIGTLERYKVYLITLKK
jgi:O-methyltransferase involved in polyketide biosynthesis